MDIRRLALWEGRYATYMSNDIFSALIERLSVLPPLTVVIRDDSGTGSPEIWKSHSIDACS